MSHTATGKHKKSTRLSRVLKALSLLAGIAVSLVALAVIAIIVYHNSAYSLPRLGGPWPVARASAYWTDVTRPDALSEPPRPQRSFTAWVWYPTVPGGKAASYVPATWQRALEREQGLGAYLHRGYGSVKPYATDSSPLAPNSHFPVLIFMPGLGPTPTDYTVLLEDLASRGYVVFALTPASSANLDLRPDGSIVTPTARGQPSFVKADFQSLNASSSPIALAWSQDVQFAMRQLHQFNRVGLFAGRLNLERVGLFGHSLGGAVSLLTCAKLPNCAAAANLDGYPYGISDQQRWQVPLLIMLANQPCAAGLCQEAHARLESILTRAGPNSARVLLDNAKHFNFSDYALTLPLLVGQRLDLLGGIAPQHGLELTRQALAAFFAEALHTTPASWPAAPEFHLHRYP